MSSHAEMINEMKIQQALVREHHVDHTELYQAVLSLVTNQGLIYAALNDDNLYLSVSGGKKELQACFSIFRHAGLDRPKYPPKENEPDYNAFFGKEGGPRILFSFTSKVCKRVKVGTEMVKKDIYETICE